MLSSISMNTYNAPPPPDTRQVLFKVAKLRAGVDGGGEASDGGGGDRKEDCTKETTAYYSLGIIYL